MWNEKTIAGHWGIMRPRHKRYILGQAAVPEPELHSLSETSWLDLPAEIRDILCPFVVDHMEDRENNKNNPHAPTPTLAVDLDGTITDAPIFFGMLCSVWPGTVIVLTYRKDRETAMADLAERDIYYDELILVNSLEEKAKVVRERGIGIVIDDQDECLQDIPEGVTVLKFRNGGNFDFDDRKWLYSARTGKQL